MGIIKGKVSYHSPEPSLRDGLEMDPAAAAEANVDGAIAILRGCWKRAGSVFSRQIRDDVGL